MLLFVDIHVHTAINVDICSNVRNIHILEAQWHMGGIDSICQGGNLGIMVPFSVNYPSLMQMLFAELGLSPSTHTIGLKYLIDGACKPVEIKEYCHINGIYVLDTFSHNLREVSKGRHSYAHT